MTSLNTAGHMGRRAHMERRCEWRGPEGACEDPATIFNEFTIGYCDFHFGCVQANWEWLLKCLDLGTIRVSLGDLEKPVRTKEIGKITVTTREINEISRLTPYGRKHIVNTPTEKSGELEPQLAD